MTVTKLFKCSYVHADINARSLSHSRNLNHELQSYLVSFNFIQDVLSLFYFSKF